MPKGSVNIEVFKERLRLAWSWQGKRFSLYMGLPDTTINQKVAFMKAQQIELDMATNNFDPTLVKYKPQKYDCISVSELFDQFVDYKRRTISIGGLNKYLALQKHVSEFFKSKTAISVSETMGMKFKEFLSQKLEPVTVRERIVLVNACWEWALKKKLIVENPWADIKVSVPPKQRPEPFTLTEISSIVQKFRSDPNLSHYADYVEFKFAVGLRTGEAAALVWRHCSANCDRIWIGESLSNGLESRKATKTNKARTVPLTPRLQQLLLTRRPTDFQLDSLIFNSTNGSAIDSKNFCNRYWKPALTALGIDYRQPYTTRHTLISHCLKNRMNPVEIAALSGHNVRTLFENYAGLVNPPQLPDLMSDLMPVSDLVLTADSQVDRSQTSE
ncbi:tyrosine-type recombinase/integrase [Microcoleus sp. AT3-D2]|uniref:tyrosine-type recombinase/integrase n=1 Tax=Microcoleus sp. AT3-D2 TaxID=2818612 RepID=UPI002FD359BC